MKALPPPSSWGRWPRGRHQFQALYDRDALPLFEADANYLPYGMGRSYGDSCQNDGGWLLATRGLDRYIEFDAERGLLRCEAGMLLKDIAAWALPRGWFVAVTPGTQYVTLGGAIANDVHGKNHHRFGSFGCHVESFVLLRSDGQYLRCSATENSDWFGATIGGLGLTGLIVEATIRLRRVPGAWIAADTQPFATLAEFLQLSEASAASHEYTVAWIDASSASGRGLFTRGNHAEHQRPAPSRTARRVPFTPPLSLVRPLSTRWFNSAYFAAGSRNCGVQLTHYRPFFYPLDGLLEWNRVYGPTGFFQYQCVLPMNAALDGLDEMLKRIARSAQGSMLSVLKVFGAQRSPAWLSFPRPGVTLALDFPNHGAPTLALLDTLDAITQQAGGAVYIAKDARMSAAAFRQYYPAWQRLAAYRDPRFSSSFWRRVNS